MTSTRPTARARRFDAGDGLAVLAFALAASTTVLAVGLTDARADAAQAREQVSQMRESARDWETDTATDAPTETPALDPTDVARGDARTSEWEGFTVGEVIVCPAGWTVSTDDTDDGGTWAACM